MTVLYLLFLSAIALSVMVICAVARRTASFRHLERPIRYISLAAAITLITLLSYVCYIGFRLILIITIHSQNNFAIPFIKLTTHLLLLPLIVLYGQALSSHLSLMPTTCKRPIAYVAALILYIGLQAGGLFMLSTRHIQNSYNLSMMAGLSILSALFYLYTYRTIRRMLRPFS